jgi:hypothetical protein
MDRALEVWEDEGGASTRGASKMTQETHDHDTLWTSVLYLMTIVTVLAVVSRL